MLFILDLRLKYHTQELLHTNSIEKIQYCKWKLIHLNMYYLIANNNTEAEK